MPGAEMHQRDNLMSKLRLQELYKLPGKVVVTAHRGFSGRFPENTLLAFSEAIRMNVDVIEFDVRGTRDNVPVIIHDSNIERTSDGVGELKQYTLKEVQKFNFSCWEGGHNSGESLSKPKFDNVTIPALQELFESVSDQVGLNTQMKEVNEPLLSTVCQLYDEYKLYDRGYLTVSTYRDIEMVRQINRKIELCVLEDQGKMGFESLEKQKSLGLHYIQPGRKDVTPEFCRHARNLDLCANMFFSNTDKDNRRYLGNGVGGILTDYPDVLFNSLRQRT